MKRKTLYKYVIFGFIAGFILSLLGTIFEDYKHNITVILALSSLHQFIAPFVLGCISALFAYIFWNRKTNQSKALNIYAQNLHSLLEINTALVSTIDLELVLQIIIDESTQLTNLDTGAIYLHENEKLYLGATTPTLPPEFPATLRYDLLANHPNIQKSLRLSQPVIIEDTSLAVLSEAEKAVVKIRGLRSIIYIPLIIENRAVGTLILGTTNNLRVFSEQEINMYQLFSGQAALTIENARLYKKSIQVTNELRQQNEEFLILNEELNERNLRIQKINSDLQLAKDKAEANELLIQKQFQDLLASEKELANTRILMQAAFDQSPIPMVVISYPDFSFKIINKATEDFLLVSAANYINKRPIDIEREWQEYTMDGKPIESVAELPLPLTMQGITTKNKEMIIERHDGSRVVELASSSPIYGTNGELIAGLLVMVDLTEHKAAEERLKENERILRLKNDEYEALNEELRQTNEELYFANEKAEESKVLIQQQYQDLQATEEEIRAANEELMATTDALVDSNKELQIAVRKAEESEIRFKSLFQNMNNSASLYEVVLNRKGIPIDYRFLDVNEYYEKSLGLKAFDLIGKTLLEVFPATEPLWLDAFKKVVTTSKPTILESYSKEMDMYFELIVYVPQKGKMAMIGTNITERKRNEIELIKAKEKAEESDQLKTAFLENISHEVRTPMNAILGFSELLLKQGLANEKRKQFTDVLQKATHQLLTVVDNTITLAHIQTKQVHIYRMEFCPAVLLTNIFDEYNHKKQLIGKSHIELIVKKPESSELQINNDFTRINQIFNILLDNAFKFTENGSIEIGYTLEANKINYYVKDTGIGIPPEKQQIIFKSFAQADKNIRQFIVINSELNTGTEIIFSLPFVEEIKQL